MIFYGSFPEARRALGQALLEAPEVKVPEWQSLDVSDKPMGITHELESVVIQCPVPEDLDDLEIDPGWGVNLPWAEEHFLERVSGTPYNPPPSAANWPYAQKGHEDHTKGEKFSHTYPERMWPKYADYERMMKWPRAGIRFNYGDLGDVVRQLHNSPMTRQAYLPIWFPEDTGVVHGERVPCSLGYHFRIRRGRLCTTYFIRSVDFIRHFPDDVYMAMRLGQWVRDQLIPDNDDRGPTKASLEFLEWSGLDTLMMGNLTMHMVSLHVFGGDMPKMRREYGA